MAYNIPANLKPGDPNHTRHHIDLANAVNDLDSRVENTLASLDITEGNLIMVYENGRNQNLGPVSGGFAGGKLDGGKF